MLVVVMGVSGAGKSTIAERLARRLGFEYVDADDLHDAAAIAKMRGGEALSEADRAPWLERLVARVKGPGKDQVLACSALTRQSRAVLAAGTEDVHFVWLDVPEVALRRRLAARSGHFFPSRLLPTQLATLEPPRDALRVDGRAEPAAIVEQIVEWLSALAPGPGAARR